LEKLQKFLTNSKYRILLEVLATSPRPLKAYEIKNKMGNKYDKYVYLMIEELVPTKYAERFLFNWDEISFDKAEPKFIRKLDDVFGLNWVDTTRSYNDLSYFKNIEIKKISNKEAIFIEYGSNHSVLIELESEKSNSAMITIFDNSKKRQRITYPLIVKKKNKKRYVYTELVSFSRPISYLNITLDEKTEQSISQIKKQALATNPEIDPFELDHLPEVLKLSNNRNNWKYSVNIRGLMLYILGEKEEENNKKKGNIEKKGRTHNIRINNVLSNLSKYYTEEFPFLLYYDEFKEEYKKLAEAGKSEHHFNVKLIKEIADELKYQLDNTDIESLKYWVTNRYSGKITEYSDLSEDVLFMYQYTHISRDQVKDYKIKTYRILMKYLQSEYNLMKKAYHYCLVN
jgi:hypothetical protein